MTDEMAVIGNPSSAIGSREITTGRAKYCPDIHLPRMLIGKLLYTRYPCAKILNINTINALEIPGVIAVLTHKDVPGENSYKYWYDDHPLFVSDTVVYQGDIIAAVAAETEEAAIAAINAIEVDYTPCDGIFDVHDAMKPNARRVWPDRDNVHSHLVIERGDLKKGFADADVVVDHTYQTHLVEHAFMETEGAVAYTEDDKSMVVYTSSQTPHRDRKQIARALNLPENMVRVITPFIGGAFGGKDEAHVQIHAALLAQATNRPVSLIRSREESFLTHVKRHPVTIHYQTGATKDGKLTAIHVVSIGDTGPYVGAGEEVMGAIASVSFGVYKVPDARLEAYTVLTNNPICGAFRGFGVPQITFAIERQMDHLANKLNMDPVELRLKNCLKTGDRLPTGIVIREAGGIKASIEEAAKTFGWNRRKEESEPTRPSQYRGWGVACTLHPVGLGHNVEDHAGAAIDMAPDGSITLRTGAADMGQGVHTILAQIAAETLGIKVESVKVFKPDTSVTPDAGPSVATRQSYISGNAVINAAQPIRKSLLLVASEETGLKPETLSLRGGYLHAEDEQLNYTVSALASKAHQRNLPMHGDGYYAMRFPGEFPVDGYPYANHVFCYGTQMAKVLVDLETCEVTIEDFVAVHDVGKAINPQSVRGQIMGGITQGIGYSLMEELIVENGQTQNLSLDSYLIPTSKDVPRIRTKLVEIYEPDGPYGAKGIGEPPINPTAPAIANAVSDALGIPIDELPITPEKLFELIKHT